MSDEPSYHWPDCAVPECPNKCCLRLNSKYCWPHTSAGSWPDVLDSLRESEQSREVA